jgi:hypothetical protein
MEGTQQAATRQQQRECQKYTQMVMTYLGA